jgi:hypothetical protein
MPVTSEPVVTYGALPANVHLRPNKRFADIFLEERTRLRTHQNVVQLREALSKRNMKKTGNKAELIERLIASDISMNQIAQTSNYHFPEFPKRFDFLTEATEIK